VPTAPVVTVNKPVVDPAVTVIVDGAVNDENPVLLREITAPPDAAAFESVTVQLLLAFAPSVVGLHCSDEITVDVIRLRLMLVDVLL